MTRIASDAEREQYEINARLRADNDILRDANSRLRADIDMFLDDRAHLLAAAKETLPLVVAKDFTPGRQYVTRLRAAIAAAEKLV
jgi:hypothetical protein